MDAASCSGVLSRAKLPVSNLHKFNQTLGSHIVSVSCQSSEGLNNVNRVSSQALAYTVRESYLCGPVQRRNPAGICAAGVATYGENAVEYESHAQATEDKVGVLLLNLGGPDTLHDVQPFLFNLFADPDIIRLPRLFRFLQWPLAKLISVVRAPKSKEGYAAIGGGSPLRKITDEQAQALKTALEAKNLPVNVYVGMRYWYPFTEEAVQQIKRDRITRLVVLPLYPQFSISTTGSSIRAKCFELSEIAGHVVEFSADQYGSRFIQQKLETATTEEKNMVYQEIMPQALALMTDVFGNYVIQKFFEHGLASQRRELANKLFGHVLTLSLQMYGCRVIQKAIEVVDLDQKIKMVEELNGHVMRCVRDQNGNHVIQKCIECVPEENIQFIVTTFFDQVVTLSTHPYGCRVIQRILEHCKDSKTQSKVMDEILGSVSMLAQDQYGNYVVQHVLEHGKPHERSIIIEELAGKIVQMSQQKFASNVVEKCLTFGGPNERQLLVDEMLGSTDENEPLQAMMKDQFANYVVQKVLETCEDQQRELILSRIKVHLNALKKYTYGKHIVARVEKLVAAGERRIAAQSPHPA